MSARAKKKILIVDDNEMNRMILTDMLQDEYDLIEAESGKQAIEIMEAQHAEIPLILLDLIMPEMNGFEVLEVLRDNQWLDDTQVVMISAETSPTSMAKAYNLGAVDYINRPFDRTIVHRRITNTLRLYAKQKYLEELVDRQIKARKKNNEMMVNILSHLVEFRNGESGQHVLHINALTELFFEKLFELTHQYDSCKKDLSTIRTASSLHDIGKIDIPGEILNKPGRLTPEEFEVIKTHAATGADMLKHLTQYQDEPLIRYATDICRWHHERYDGKGYPDGLSGDEIPIAAQVVALADVYDALTSKRCYKPAFSHEEAVRMITGGECGCFNPLLLECLKNADAELRRISARQNREEEEEQNKQEIRSVVTELKNMEE